MSLSNDQSPTSSHQCSQLHTNTASYIHVHAYCINEVTVPPLRQALRSLHIPTTSAGGVAGGASGGAAGRAGGGLPTVGPASHALVEEAQAALQQLGRQGSPPHQPASAAAGEATVAGPAQEKLLAERDAEMAAMREELAKERVELGAVREAHQLELRKQAAAHAAELEALRAELSGAGGGAPSGVAGLPGSLFSPTSQRPVPELARLLPAAGEPSGSVGVELEGRGPGSYLVEPLSVTLAKLAASRTKLLAITGISGVGGASGRRSPLAGPGLSQLGHDRP